MAATALSVKWYGPSPADPSSGTTGLKASGWIAFSRLKNDAWPTPSPPREWPTRRIRSRSTFRCSRWLWVLFHRWNCFTCSRWTIARASFSPKLNPLRKFTSMVAARMPWEASSSHR
jgi:hypothetical protein